MKYLANAAFEHAQPRKTGVLITNLGTPEQAEKKAVRRFLREFLSDPRVVEIPRLVWLPILYGIILNVRPARSAAAYAKIWTDRGSPLLLHTHDQAAGLQRALEQGHGDDIVVDYAMRYGEPSLASVLQRMQEQGVDRLVVLPLYPHYSCATTGSTFDAIAANFQQRRWVPDLQFIGSYHDHPQYISAVANSIRQFREQHGSADKLVFSYHGEPRRYLDQGDPYHCQCLKTTRLIATELGLAPEHYITTFQSRFGKAEWLRPYTDETLGQLPKEGTESVQVICPGFAADCLETLEEIAMENRDIFTTAGGKRFEYIPCLNSDAGHITALAAIVEERLAGWRERVGHAQETAALALAAGAKK